MKNYFLLFLFVFLLFYSCSSNEDSDEILVENNIEIPLSIYQKIYKTTSEIYIEDGFVYINTDGVPDHKSPYFLDTEWENEMSTFVKWVANAYMWHNLRMNIMVMLHNM